MSERIEEAIAEVCRAVVPAGEVEAFWRVCVEAWREQAVIYGCFVVEIDPFDPKNPTLLRGRVVLPTSISFVSFDPEAFRVAA